MSALVQLFGSRMSHLPDMHMAHMCIAFVGSQFSLSPFDSSFFVYHLFFVAFLLLLSGEIRGFLTVALQSLHWSEGAFSAHRFWYISLASVKHCLLNSFSANLAVLFAGWLGSQVEQSALEHISRWYVMVLDWILFFGKGFLWF